MTTEQRLMASIDHCKDDVLKALHDSVRDKRLEKLLAPLEKDMQAHIIAIFKDWEEKIGNIPIEDLDIFELQGVVTRIIDGRQLGQDISEKMFQTFYEALNINPETATGFLPATSPFGLADKRALDYFRVFPLLVSERLSKRVEFTLRDEIARGVTLGESIPKIRTRILQLFNDLKGYEAERVARTETRAAFAWGQINAMRQVGAEMWEFYATEDERTCPICAPLHKKRFLIDDLEHLPPKHPNCRCTTLNVIPELEDLEGDAPDLLKWFPSERMAEIEFRRGESIRAILYDMHITKSMSYRAIGKEFDISHQSAGDWIKRLRVKDIIKAGFKPSQPRDAGGQSSGGQWSGGAGKGSSAGKDTGSQTVTIQKKKPAAKGLVSLQKLKEDHSFEDIISDSDLVSQLTLTSQLDAITTAFEEGYYSLPISETPGGIGQQHMDEYDEWELELAKPDEVKKVREEATTAALEDLWQQVIAGELDKEISKLKGMDFRGRRFADAKLGKDGIPELPDSLREAVLRVGKDQVDVNVEDELRNLWEDYIQERGLDIDDKAGKAIYDTGLNFEDNQALYHGGEFDRLAVVLAGDDLREESVGGLFVAETEGTASGYGQVVFKFEKRAVVDEFVQADPDIWNPDGWTSEQSAGQYFTDGVRPDVAEMTVISRRDSLVLAFTEAFKTKETRADWEPLQDNFIAGLEKHREKAATFGGQDFQKFRVPISVMKKVAAEVLAAPSLTDKEIKAFRTAKIAKAEAQLIKVITLKTANAATLDRAKKTDLFSPAEITQIKKVLVFEEKKAANHNISEVGLLVEVKKIYERLTDDSVKASLRKNFKMFADVAKNTDKKLKVENKTILDYYKNLDKKNKEKQK